MKWIGQHIYDLASRFRNDVFLEDISSGTIASGAHLGLDSNNKIVKAADGGGDVTLAGAQTFTGSKTMATDVKLNFRDANSYIFSKTANDLSVIATDITLDAAGTIIAETDHLRISSPNSTTPLFQLKNETDDASGPRLKFNKLRGADGQDGDSCGIIQFASFDDGTPSTQFYGQIETKIADATSGQEAGDMFFQVPSYDGVLTSGLIIRGDTDADGEVDVNIAAGAASTTTIAGILTMGSTATINNSGVVQVAAQTVIDHDQLANFAANEHFTQANITTVGTISTGEWRGTVINGAYIDDDAIDGDSIADDAVDSEHYTDGSIDTAHIADDQVTFAKAIGVSPKVYGTKIKILPSDFMSNDDGGSTKFGIGFVEADGTGFGMKIPNASTELLAFVSIPEGMKATHVDIFDQEDDRVIEVFEANINSRTITSKGSGNCNTTLDITDVNATAVNYLLILVTTTATSDRVYGGTITIAAQ